MKYHDLKPCFDAFIDTRTPGSDKKENFTIIGPGVSENPNQYVHIKEAHGFNIGAARQPPHCTNSQHSHETVEFFYVHSGRWRFDLGEHCQDAQAILTPGDAISIPTNVFRGFTNIGEDTGFLWAVLGGDDPGRVLWAPTVFGLAQEYGLVLLEDGMLIDTQKGGAIPAGKRAMPVTTPDQVAALDRFDNEQLEDCVLRAASAGPRGPFNAISGIEETMLIGEGRIDRPHGFRISEVTLAPGTMIPSHSLDVADVYFVQDGQVILALSGQKTIAATGDTITFPKGQSRSIQNASDRPVKLLCVRGGDQNPHVHWL